MKKIKSAVGVVALSCVAAAMPASAQEAASEWTVSGNAGLFSDYRFRGISQTNKKPAFQGGFDVAHASGFYLGNWNSNVDSDFFGGANLELDFYGGYKGSAGDFGYDVGALYYYYPGSDRDGAPKIKNTEVYVGASYGTLSAKLFYPLSDFFSAEDLVEAAGDPDPGNAAGSYYLDLSGAYDLGGGFGLAAHVGYQKLKGAARLTEIGGSNPVSSYVDWKLGATYTFGSGFVLGLAYIDTNRDFQGAVADRKISDSTAVLSLSKTF